MSNPQLAPESFYRALVTPTVQPHVRDEGARCHRPDACRLRDGCHLVKRGAICSSVCMVWVSER